MVITKLAKRIKIAREKEGMSRNELSKLIDVSRAAISQWESGATTDLKARYLFPLAKALKIDPMELYWGTPSIPEQLRNTPMKFVPLLSYAEVGEKVKDEKPLIPTTAENASFAVKITGDAMSPKFEPDAVVIFDATSPPESGNCILAQTANRVFRQYQKEGGVVSLTAFNEKYPTIQMEEKELECLGVAVQKVENLV